MDLHKNRDFLLYLLTRACTATGFQMLAVAIGWHVYLLTGNVRDLGLIGLFMFAPFLLFFLLAGLAADRMDRRHIVSGFSLVDVAATFGIGGYLLSGPQSVWPIFGLLFLAATAQAFIHPASQAIVPNLVPREQLARAIATQTSVVKAAQLGGPAVGGVLIALIDIQTYFVIAALFLGGALFSSRIRTPLKVSGKEPFGLAIVLGGFRHIWRTRPVLGAVTIDLIAVLFGGVMGILPAIAKDVLHVGPEALGVLRAAPAIGGLGIAMALARFGLPWRPGAAFLGSLAIFGVAILVFSLSKSFVLSIAALAVYGGADMISVYVRQTLIQLNTPDALRGRVSAVNAVAVSASNQLGDFRAGMMSAVTGAPAAVAIGGGVVIGVTVLWMRLFPELRRLEKL